VDEKGHIQLKVDRAEREAIAVKEGNVDWIHKQRAGVPSQVVPPPGTRGNANHGVALPGRVAANAFKPAEPQSAVAGFSDSAKDMLLDVLKKGAF
jgi:hypothetical protein